jgi:hypothetical protein
MAISTGSSVAGAEKPARWRPLAVSKRTGKRRSRMAVSLLLSGAIWGAPLHLPWQAGGDTSAAEPYFAMEFL